MLNNLLGQQDEPNDQAFALLGNLLCRDLIDVSRLGTALALFIVRPDLINDLTEELLCVK